jgi:hypothetical protein
MRCARPDPHRTHHPHERPTTRKTEEENAMAIAALSTIQPTAPRQDAISHATRRQQAKRVIRQRLRRIPGFLLVLALLLPLLITALFGSH